MSSKESFIGEMHEGCARFKPQIAPYLHEYCLVVVAVLRHRHTHWSGLRPAPRASCPLLVVLDAWGYVATDHRFQITDVHAKFHRGRATQQADLAFFEVAFNL